VSANLEVRVDPAECLGSQGCVRRAPQVFQLGADGKARASDPAGVPEALIVETARACPSFAISVERDGETLV
jgi:ferredoxin